MPKQYHRLLITGGATGFGKALALVWAKQFANEGKSLAICIADIHNERAEETIAELIELNVDAFYCHCDITVESQVHQLREQVIQRWAGIDTVINNAGVATGGSLKSEPLSQWNWVFDINLFGMVRVCQTFVDDFRQQGKGYFINVASQAGLTPIPMMSSYNAVKAAVVSFSETLRLELASDNIAVSVVCPSFFKTHLNESMRSSEATMHETINYLFSRADMTAEQVAMSVYQQAQSKKFLMLTHKEGKRAYFMKKWLSSEFYLKQVIKGTRKLVERARKTVGESK